MNVPELIGFCTVVLTLGVLLVRAQADKRRAHPTLRYRVDGARPLRGTPFAAGYDLACDQEIVLRAQEVRRIPTGMFLEIPEGLFGMVTSRGSAASKGIFCQGTIDSDYRGEIFVLAANLTSNPIVIPAHKAVAQVILIPYRGLPLEAAPYLTATGRQAQGFGSTGLAL